MGGSQGLASKWCLDSSTKCKLHHFQVHAPCTITPSTTTMTRWYSSTGLAYWALYQSSTSTTIVVNLLVVVVRDYYCTNTTNSSDTFQRDLFRPSLHLFKFFRIVWLKRLPFKFCCHKPIFWVWPRDFGQSSLQNLWWCVTIRKISSIHEHLWRMTEELVVLVQ